MPLHFQPQPSQGASVTSPMEPVEASLGARVGDGLGELTATQATDAFHRLFEGLTERRQNQRIVEAAQLSHGADGVLRPVGMSPKKRSETLSEGGR